MLGTWEIAKMKKSSLPEKVASGFSEATKNLKGAEYRPVLYCGKQVVAGTNHMSSASIRFRTRKAPSMWWR